MYKINPPGLTKYFVSVLITYFKREKHIAEFPENVLNFSKKIKDNFQIKDSTGLT